MAKGRVSGVNACREIAENIPQKSRMPVIFGGRARKLNNVPEMAADRATL
jgi:hypothetical protein